MPRCKPINELQAHLRHWLHDLILIIKDALDLWMHTSEDLPSYMQHAQSEAASQSVHAAIHEAAQLMNRSEQEQLAWLLKYLPGISTVMQECLRIHLDIITKRISIIHSILASQYSIITSQRGGCDKVLKELVAERDTYVLVEILGWVFFTVQPAAIVANALLAAEAAAPEAEGNQHSRNRRQQLQDSVLQRVQVIDMLGLHMQEACGICVPLHEHILAAKRFLERVGLTALHIPDEGVFQKLINAYKWLGIVHSCLTDLASKMANCKASTAFLAYILHCAVALGTCMKGNFPTWHTRLTICRIVCCRSLCSRLIELHSAAFVVKLFQTFDIKKQHLKEEGISDRQLQQLQAALGVDIDKIGPPNSDNNAVDSASSYSTEGFEEAARDGAAGSSQSDGVAHAAVNVTVGVSGEAAECSGGEFVDMKALLHDMYGGSIPCNPTLSS